MYFTVAIVGDMATTGRLTAFKARCYRWQAIFLSLWLTVAYLWMALFFPLMCAPYRTDNYSPIDPVTAFEHTITPYSVMAEMPIKWSHLVRMTDSSNAAWLLDSHTDVIGVALTFIAVISLPLIVWLAWANPRRSVQTLLAQLYTHLHIAPLERPPRFTLA